MERATPSTYCEVCLAPAVWWDPNAPLDCFTYVCKKHEYLLGTIDAQELAYAPVAWEGKEVNDSPKDD